MDGSIYVWNASVLCQSIDNEQKDNSNRAQEALLFTLSDSGSNHGPVVCLAYSPLEPFNIATGTAHGQAYFLPIDQAQPALCTMNRHAAEVTAVAWNSQVPHIVATACATDGSVVVWDTKANKPWCELRTQSTSHLAWNPRQGLQLLTADGPNVNVWDLANSTSLPFAQLAQGYHTSGILKMDWCPHDEALLVTTAKDGKAFCWDLQSLQPLVELPNDSAPTDTNASTTQKSASSLFAGSSTPSHVRYEIHWSPHQRGVLLTCRLDKHVQVASLPALPRPPAWMRPGCRVAQGFGATVARLDPAARTVTLEVVSHNFSLVETVTARQTLAPRDLCLVQQDETAAVDPARSAMWGFLSVLFEPNSRQALTEYLGYQAEEIVQAIQDFEPIPGVGPNTSDEPSVNKAAADELVQRALVVGDFASAVEACLAVENYADALLLASCGGAELWQTTQQKYLEKSRRPFVSTVQAVLEADKTKLVETSDLNDWQQTLAILSTYCTSQEFPQLVQSLAKRVQEAGDPTTASLCYICAMDFEAVVKYWLEEFKGAENSDWEALCDFCTKVSVFQQACPSVVPPEAAVSLFTQYATLLADEGMLVAAAVFAKDGILSDRLYRSRCSPACLAAMQNQPPAFPYTMHSVEACRGVVSLPEQRQAAIQAKIAAEQQAEYAKQQAEYQKQLRESQQAAAAAQQAAQAQSAAHGHQQQGCAQQAQLNSYQGYNGNSAPQSASSLPTTSELPPGWIALQDPNSGMTYYANQTTGETTWDRPASAPAPAPASATQLEATPTRAKKTLASKYGDGFVSSASDPKLAYQYGNVGTSNPYHGAERPGPAAVGTSQQAPVSDSFNVDELQLSADLAHIRDSLMQLVDHLKTQPLAVPEKRQLSDGEKAVAVFLKKLARQAIHDETLVHSQAMVNALVSSDFRTATAMQTTLVNSDWREHKDWLKGFKSLIQLASKKLSHPHPNQY